MAAIVSSESLGLNTSSLATLGPRAVNGNTAQGRGTERVYVNVASGNLVLQDADERLVGSGLSIEGVRTYNSQGKFDGAYTPGPYNVSGLQPPHLEFTGKLLRPGTTVTRVDQDGGTTYYDFDTTRGVYLCTDGAGAYDTIAYDGSSLIWTDGDTGVTERYADGKPHNWALAERRDPDGNTLTFSYNRWGQVERIVTASGESTLFDYTNGLLTQVRNVTRDGPAAGTVRVRYDYDHFNRLINASVDLSPADNRISDGRVYNTRYEYDGVSDRVSAVTQDDGSVNRFTYVHLLGDYRLASLTDALGQTTRYDYDLGARRTTVTDPLGLVTRYDYDGAGQLLRITGPAVQSGPQVQSFVYNSRGDVTQVTDARGLVTAMEYDRNGNLVLQRDAAGNTVARSYGARNQLLTETVYAMPDPDGAGSTRPGQPQTSHYVYDSRLNLRFVVSAEGRVTEYRYNATGQRTAELHHAAAYQDGAAWPVAYPQPLPSNSGVSVGGYTGASPTEALLAAWVARQAPGQALRTDYGYDFRGQLAQQTRYTALRADGSGAPDSSAVSRFIYDANGRLLQTVAATGGITRTTYDGLNRLLAAFDALGNSTLVRYDDAGNRTLTTQANGLQDIAQYDRAGRLIAHMQVDTAGTVLGSIRYDYDADGRLRRSTDPTGVQRWMLYDAAGRLTGEIDGDGSLTEYVYNADDVLLQTIRYANRISTRPALTGAYVDELPRLRPAVSSEDVRTWRVLDNANRVVAQVDGADTVTRIDYDGASRVLRSVVYATAIDTSKLTVAPTLTQVLPASSADDRVTRRFYDQDGLLRGELDAAGTLRETRYDAAGQPVMRIAYARPTDPALRAGATLAQLLPAASRDDIVEHLQYDARGLLVADIDGEGYLTSYRYDGNGNRTDTMRYAQALTNAQRTALVAGGISATLPQIASLTDQHQQFTYDLLNRLTTRTDTAGTVIRNDYDSMGRLTASTTAAGTLDARTQTRRYDLQGRLVAELSGEGSAALAAPGSSVAAVWQAYATSYSYDAAGRLTSRTDANGHRTLFFYNVDGQMVYAINPLGEVEAHRHDGLSQETRITRYATRLDAATLANLRGGLAGAALDTTITALANASTDAVTTFVYDRAGRQIDRTDALGVHTRQRYDSFGDAIATVIDIETGPIETRRRFDARGLLLTETRDATGLAATTRQEFDAFGRLISSTDANGNIRSTHYDRLGRTVQFGDATGATQSTAYDAYSRIIIRTDALGNATTLRYDDQARSTTLTTAEGVTVTTVMSRHGQTQSVTDGNGNVTRLSYDLDGNQVAQDTALAHTASHYDHAGLLIETIDGNGTSTTLRYDAANRVLSRMVDPSGLALTTSYAYDALGRIVQNTDPNGTVTTFRYDRAGQLLQQVVDPDGLALQTGFTWDARGQQLSVTDANGILTRYQYDGLGRRIAQTRDADGLALTTRHTYDANGNLLSSTDAAGHTSRYAYDAENRLRYSVDGAGDVTALSYDAAGHIIQSIRYAQAISIDGLSSDIAARVTASPTDIIEYHVLDRDGLLAWTVDGRGAVNAYRRDGNGNVIEQRGYATAINLASWQRGSAPPVTADDAHDLRLRTLYDAANRAIATLDGAGALSVQHYDANGNLIDRTRYATPLPAGASFNTQTVLTLAERIANPATDASERYSYDAANRQANRTDGTGALTVFRYDSNGNLLRTIAYANALPPGAPSVQPQPSDADRVTDMVYDAANRLTWQVDALGQVTHREFDRNGNLLILTAYAHAPAALTEAQRALPDAAALQAMLAPDAQQDRVLRYAYDGANRMVYAIDAEGALTHTVYDALGQPLVVTRHAQWLTAPDLQAIDAAATPRAAFIALLSQADLQHDRSTRQLYDAAGRVVTTIDAEGYLAQSRYDAVGRLLQRDNAGRSEQWTWDAASHLVQHIDALGLAESWQVDALGNRVAWRNANGALWQYEYDAAGRMSAEITPEVTVTSVSQDGKGNLVMDGQPAPQRLVTRLRYDALGNLRARTEADSRPDARTTLYDYDALGRQIRTLFPPVGVYDAALDDPVQNGSSDLAPRTERLQTLFSATRYDSFGDAIAGRDVAGNTSHKTYDRMGRLAVDVDAAGYVSSYRRNAYGDIVALTRHALPVALPSTSDSAAVDAALTRTTADRSLQQSVDRNGRLTQVMDAAVTIYDPDAAPGQQLFTAGAITRNRYNAFGEQVESTQLKDSQTGQWLTTHYDYDRRGQQVAILDALHYRTTLGYDAWGNLIERIEFAQAAQDGSASSSPDDRITRLTWDAANRKTSETRVNVDYSDPAAPTVTVRGDLVTRYGYDAVGNLTRVTDAAGASTFTWYDALGRTTAVAAPAHASTPDGTVLIPLTEFQRDAFGNVLVQIDRALGTQQANEASYTPAASSSADRLTVMQYDSHGHLVQSTDAMGVSQYRSYDAHGQLAKAWQAVATDEAGHRATQWQVWRRDGLGREVDWRESQNIGDAAAHGTAYNAFGEVVARGIDGGWQEFFDYDQAGRLWRSNAGDGQVKVMLHDLQGNTTALIQGNGRAAFPADSAYSAALATDVRRTDTRYDLLGRVIAQTHAEQDASFFLADAATLRWPQPRAGVAQTLTLRFADGNDWSTLAIIDAGNSEDGADIAALPEGDYVFELRQTGPDGSIVTLPGHLHIGAGKPGQVVGADGVPVIGNITLRASTTGAKPGGKDAAAWLVWGNAGEGSSQRFEYRTASSSEAWRSLPVLARGNGYYGVDRSAIPAGRYEYRLQLIPAGATEPARTLTGEVVLAAYAPLKLPTTERGTVPATVLQWPMPPAGATAVLMVRAIGNEEWTEITAATEIMGVDAEGQPVGVQKAVLDELPAGSWEYDLSFLRDDVVVAHASGQFDIPDDGSLPVLTDSTIASTAYTLPASSRIATVTSSPTLRPEVHQTVDRWGNVLAVDDPRSPDWQTRTRYNAANQVLEQTRPDAGQGAPITRFFYDRMGRQIAMLDANGNAAVNDYDAAGQLVAERHADGGVVRHFYDAFGNVVRTIDPNGHASDSVYDKLGRQIATRTTPVEVFGFDANGALADTGQQSIVETTRYDEAGRIVARTDGLGNTTRYRYDLHGNLIDVIQPLGQQARYQYDHHNRQSGMTDANGYQASWHYDDFGHLLSHTDIGGAVTHTGYDSAGQMVTQTTQTGQNLRYSYDVAGKLVQIVDAANHKTTTYAYDAAGNRVAERTLQDGLLLQDNTLHFDSLGRMTDVTDRADGEATVRISYDRLGNRVHITTDIAITGITQHQEGWYGYDAMNRQVLVNAANPAGELGAQGHRVSYDLAGNRVSDTWQSRGQDTTAGYEYDAMNRLVRTLRDGRAVEQRLYDAASRLVYQAGLPDPGLSSEGLGEFGQAIFRKVVQEEIKARNEGIPQADQLPDNQRTYRYDANGRLLSQRVNDLFGNPDYLVDYSGSHDDLASVREQIIGQLFDSPVPAAERTDGYDAAGNLLQYRVIKYGDNGYTNTFTNHLVRYEGYVVDRTDGQSTLYEDGSTTRQYDPYGNLTAITDAREAANNRTFYNDATGQALMVRQGDKVQRQLIANGQVLGRYGTAPDPVKPKDDDAHPQFTTSADLNFTYQVVNDRHPGTTPTGYSVQPGDTLQGIARQAYGDAGYWYRIAEANGLDARTALHPGQQLQLPTLTGTTYDRADSMRPYDASQIIGDTTPTMPPPPADDGGCGILGMLIVIVVAVVVAWYAPQLIGPMVNAAGIGGTAGTVVTGVLAGAAASVVSQGVAIAIGVQDSFSWSQVGLGFISGGVAAGIGTVATGAMAGQGTFAVVSRAMVANALAQGIGVATGLQDQFSWVSVAAAGVGAGVGQAVGIGLQGTAFADTFGRFGVVAASSFVGGLASAVTRGGRINLAQVAVDAFGSVLGSSIVEHDWSGGAQDTARENFRRSEIEAMNNDARIANALAMSGPGMSEEDYWNAPARTTADQYADSYGGAPIQTARKFQGTDSLIRQQEIARITSQAWDPSYYTSDGNIRIEINGVAPVADSLSGDWSPTGMPDNSPLHVVGQSADGGLIWNTGTVSYPVGSPEIEVHALTNIANSTTQPVYDPLTGMPTGYTTEADNVDTPTMRYGDQMRNVGAFVGTLGKNFGLGVAQGTIGLVSDAAKGWAMIGDMAFTGGRNISQLEQFNLRPFQYDAGAGQFAGGFGEMVSPGAYAKAAELGVVGLRALGPTADAAIYNYLQRSGGVLNAAPEGNGVNTVPLGFKQIEDFEAFAGLLHSKLNGAGFSNVNAAFQGSSVTGRAFRPPHSPFDLGRVSDFDLAISSPELFKMAQSVGIGLRQQGSRTGPLSLEKTPEFLERMGLTNVTRQLTLEAGRPVNFMIYRSLDDALLRSPSIVIPR